MLVSYQSQRQSIAQVCGPSLCTQNRLVNLIAAHKDELKKLVENLSGDAAVSGITFVASGCLYRTPRYELLRHQGPEQSAASANKRRINMEPTLTRNCAPYYAQHKTSKGRAALFRKFAPVACMRRHA